eukprot:CAMPEP_0175825926 /NCGR_PEP_ID=MMETSP0107_2-20121207/11502_1 /TAXON_ID=195067 ORGANISM="Goniomonas pacifica, Strain CCMP1869" /NCGR_SAMPLE_ID=MMETSP0107_2 /ASSEMBLY_ACC=CAM_ASM_000203 /LENGTH=171 /DNA_ID=CAMNT_0017138551 /DNA_START=95 /DNA_END=608 /DNA_ORIENTATION=-
MISKQTSEAQVAEEFASDWCPNKQHEAETALGALRLAAKDTDWTRHSLSGLIVRGGTDTLFKPYPMASGEGCPESDTMLDLIGAALKTHTSRFFVIQRGVTEGYLHPKDWPTLEWAVLSRLADSMGKINVHWTTGLAPPPRLVDKCGVSLQARVRDSEHRIITATADVVFF